MNVFDLSAKIALDTNEYIQGLNSASTKTDSFGNKLASAFGAVAKASAAAIAAATGAAAALSKQVVDAYGSYEQLVGGVEKLFGEQSSKIIENAEKAFQTAGLSANEYMETVTSFSASLISSLGGDTQRAVDYADMALRDMSDNANTFGSDIASIQAAYQGFAKQNYTMLDNLKLGYGGTKTEMERLIKDANRLKVAQGKMADLTVESYADIVEAIHLVQEEMNIAGTTARESSDTIEGSMNSLKGSITNLWTELGKSDGNVRKSTQIVIESFRTMLDNIVPIVKNIAKLLPEVFDEIIEELPKILPDITDIFNSLVDIGFEIIEASIKALPSILEQIPSLVSNIVQNIVEIILGVDWLEVIGSIALSIMTSITGIFEGIVRGSSEAVNAWYEQRDAIREAVSEYEKALESAQNMNEERKTTYENLYAEIGLMEDIKNKMIEYTDEQGHVKEGYEDEMDALIALAEAQGIHIEVVDGEIQGYSDLITSIDEAIRKRKEEAITAAETQMYEEAYKERRRLDSEYRDHYQAYLDAIAKADEARIAGDTVNADKYMSLANEELAAVETLAAGIVENSAQMELASYNMTQAAAGNFDDLATTYEQAGIDLANYETEVKNTNSAIIDNFEDTFKIRISDAIKEGNHDAWYALHIEAIAAQTQANADYAGVANYSIDGFEEALYGGRSRVIEASKSIMRSAINAAKAEAQIQSPSKVFAWMGDMMTAGLEGSLEDGSNKTAKAAQNMVKEINDTMSGLNTSYNFDVDTGMSNMDLTRNDKESGSEALLFEIASRLDNLEQSMYDALSRVLVDGLDLRWNDRELTRLVREHA